MFGGVDNIKLIVLLIFEELRVPHGNDVNLWGYVKLMIVILLFTIKSLYSFSLS